jgi:hypothetical protein
MKGRNDTLERYVGHFFLYINSLSYSNQFTSHTVPSKPSNLIRHTKKVPPSSSPDEQVQYGNMATTNTTNLNSDTEDENVSSIHYF